jgi:hypothetical protein
LNDGKGPGDGAEVISLHIDAFVNEFTLGMPGLKAKERSEAFSKRPAPWKTNLSQDGSCYGADLLIG